MLRYIKTFLSTSIPFGLFMGLYYALIMSYNTTSIVILSLGSGVFFGLCMTALVASPGLKQSATPQFHSDEHILKSSPANHVSRLITIGGWLYLTNKRLIFQSHTFVQPSYERIFSLATITDAQPSMTAWIVPNGLTITTRDGQIERFVVAQRQEWSAAIQAHRSDVSLDMP
jgi:hypothetical protein